MSDAITFSCNHCGSSLTVPASLAGVSGPCPVCGQTITSPKLPAPVPVPEPIAAAAPPPAETPAAASAIPTAPPKTTLPPPREEPPAPWGQNLSPADPRPLSYEPRSSSGSPLAHTLAILLILGGVGAAAFYFFRPFFDRTPLPEKSASGVTVPGKNDPPKVAPPKTPVPPKPPTPPVVSPVAAPGIQPPAEVTIPKDPVPPPVPQDPAPAPQPKPPVATPGAIAIETVVPPAPTDPTASLPDLQESLVREFQNRLDAFFQANSPKALGPLLFSETDEASKLAEAVEKGTLSKIPKLEYKAVLAFDGPREGISQYYVAVTNTAAAEEAPNRELLLHLANQGNQGFRVNADVLRFQLANDLPTFVADPGSEPLRAYVFIERAHFFSGENQESPRGHICVNLRLGPYTPVICQALVDPGTEAGLEIAPLANWGDSPKAVIVTLKHANVYGVPAITIDKFHCGNWLVAFPKAPNADNP